jgi:hypothetical protein
MWKSDRKENRNIVQGRNSRKIQKRRWMEENQRE